MKYLKPISCLLLLLLTISCAPATAPKVGFNSVAQESKIVYIRADGQIYTLSRYLKVVKEVTRRSEAGLLSGIVILNNNSRKIRNLVCDVQFVFLDQDGIELEKTNWQPIVFSQGVDTTIKQVAMNPMAQDYKVYVKEPKTMAN
jgi:uncharacterized protein YcfL